MEHIVQFAIGMDDEAIQKRIEENAYQDALKSITKQVWDAVFPEYLAPYSRGEKEKELAFEAVSRFMEKHQDEIIDKTANRLVERFSRTKKFREAMGAVIEKDGE